MYNLLKFIARLHHLSIDYLHDVVYAFILMRFNNYSDFGMLSFYEDLKLRYYQNDTVDSYVAQSNLSSLVMDNRVREFKYWSCITYFMRECLCWTTLELQLPLDSYFNALQPVPHIRFAHLDRFFLARNMLGIESLDDPIELRSAAREIMSVIDFRTEYLRLKRWCRRSIQNHILSIINWFEVANTNADEDKFVLVLRIIEDLPIPKMMKEYLLMKEFNLPLYIIFERLADDSDAITFHDVVLQYVSFWVRYIDPFLIDRFFL